MSLNEMEKMWQGINFNLLAYKNTYLIKNYDEIQQVLDQHIVNTQSMQFSPFKKPFEERIMNWNNKLKIMSDVLEEWAKCQEYKKFKTIDMAWRNTMEQASKGIRVL